MFDAGAFASGLLTGLREGVEAALIVAIICSYLARTGNARHFGKIWLGVGAAVAISLALGALVYVSVGGLDEPYEQIFEGLTMLFAAGVVTWMLFWMRRQARSVRGDLQRAIDRVLTEGTAWGLAVLAFTAVIREGLETALFLVGQATAAADGVSGESGAPAVLAGALVGLGIAVAIGYGFYRGSQALDIRSFFRGTGVLLIFIAAGLLSHAVHEFVEIGWITVGTSPAFDIGAVLPHDQGIGLFLGAIFGYTSSPEWVTLITWVTYVVVVLVLYLRPGKPSPVEPRPAGLRPEPTGAAPAAGD
jgi:high-affinity iron transporter